MKQDLQVPAKKGFAIPMILLVIVVLTVSVAAGFTMLTGDRQSVSDSKAAVTAFTIAQQGLEIFMAKRDSLGLTAKPPGLKDSVRIALSDGYADVISNRLITPTNLVGGYYSIRSTGVMTSGTMTGTPDATRTVIQIAKWQPAQIQILGAVTSLTGFYKAGTAGDINGADACGDSTTRTGTNVDSTYGYGYNGQGIQSARGNPPIDTIPPDSIHIDWANILNSSVIAPTITIPPGSMPTAAQWADTLFWPTILVKNGYNNTFTLGANGRGTLIVQGNLTIGASDSWRGIMLVGGQLTSGGNSDFDGAITSGLNKKIPGVSVLTPSFLANGTKSYYYNSCTVAKAMSAMGAAVRLSNAWMDNWAKY
jgi:hypothetical protein